VKLAELSNNSFERKNVTFYGVKTYSDPSNIFQGSGPPSTHDLRPSQLYDLYRGQTEEQIYCVLQTAETKPNLPQVITVTENALSSKVRQYR